jgi:ribonuclease J
MKIRIHRGSKEIGGSCVELQSHEKRLLIDMGTPLVNPDGTGFDNAILKESADQLIAKGILPDIQGLYNNDTKNISGIILSHAHLDHTGLAAFAGSHVPAYMSEGTQKLIDIMSIFVPNPVKVGEPVLIEKMWEPIMIGPFKVIAHPVDHSSPGAISVEIEADGKRIFYTGDFRGHGRLNKLFENMINRPPKNIDIMVMEGSSFGRTEGEYSYSSEEDVEEGIYKSICNANNTAFIFCAAQNLSRIISAYKAAARCSRIFVIDLYTAYILEQFKYMSKRLPQYYSDDIAVKFFSHQQRALENSEKNEFVKRVMLSGNGIKMEKIAANPSKYLMLVRANSLLTKIADKLPDREGIKLIWSMWGGYITGEDTFSQFCRDYGYKNKWDLIHCSGHATIKDLEKLVNAVNPRHLVPIHTFHPESYETFGVPVKYLSDGEEFDLN